MPRGIWRIRDKTGAGLSCGGTGECGWCSVLKPAGFPRCRWRCPWMHAGPSLSCRRWRGPNAGLPWVSWAVRIPKLDTGGLRRSLRSQRVGFEFLVCPRHPWLPSAFTATASGPHACTLPPSPSSPTCLRLTQSGGSHDFPHRDAGLPFLSAEGDLDAHQSFNSRPLSPR